MHPDQERWQVTRDPRVTQINIWGLEPDREPPRFRVHFEFAGRRQFADPTQVENAGGDPTFVGMLDLTLTDSGPWHLESGWVETLEQPRNRRAVSPAYRLVGSPRGGHRAAAQVPGHRRLRRA